MLWPGEAPYEKECAGQERPSITAYPVQGARGAVIICPGGGYTAKVDWEKGNVAQMYNAQGIAAYTLDYRVTPCPHDAPLTDARRAIRVVRAMGYQKVAIAGFSAGGNLCCCAATLYEEGNPFSTDPVERFSSRPDAFISCYSVVSMGQYTHIGSRKALLGENWQDEELIRRYSAELNVTEDTPPAFIWHTAEDELVPAQNSLLLAMALANHGVAYQLYVYPHGQHGLSLGEAEPEAAAWGLLSAHWLLSMGFGA